MWGSNYPGILMNCSYRETLDLIREECDFLSTQEKKMILGETAPRCSNFDKDKKNRRQNNLYLVRD